MFVIVCVQIIVLLMLYNIWRHDRIKNREGIEFVLNASTFEKNAKK